MKFPIPKRPPNCKGCVYRVAWYPPAKPVFVCTCFPENVVMKDSDRFYRPERMQVCAT